MLSPLLPDLDKFLILARTQNISRAAEVSGVKQSGLSKSLQRLEQHFGMRLFSRSKQGIRLTADGQRVYQIAKGLVAHWNSAMREQPLDEISGQIRIGCHSIVAAKHLPLFLPKILEEHPAVHVEVALGKSLEVTRQVINADLDFGLVISPQRHPELVIRSLQKEIVGVWAPKQKSENSRIIFYNPDMINIHQYLKKYQNYRLVPLQDYQTIAAIVASSKSLGIFPESLAGHNLQLVRKLYEAELCLIYRKDRSQSAVSKLVISMMKEWSS